MRRKKNRFVEPSDNKFLQMVRDFVEVCPTCKSIHISVRLRKIPKYRCRHCGNEFDNPNAEIVQKTRKQINEFGRQYHNPDE